MRAKLTAIGSDAKVQASAFGTRTVHVSWRSDAPRVRQKLRVSASIDSAPLYVLKNTAKNTMNHAITTFDVTPRPKNIVMSGTIAIRGRLLTATMKGRAMAATRRL